MAKNCDLCPRRCLIAPGGSGFCGARTNRDGTVVSKTYGRFSSIALDPIEKKPLYHFLPGTKTLSLGGSGCNLDCRFCQNFHISRDIGLNALSYRLTPTELAALAKEKGAPSVSFTYNEPIINIEYVTAAAKELKRHGIRTVAVTNGHISEERRAEFFADIAAANVDLKAFNQDFYRDICGGIRLADILTVIKWLALETDVHLELTTLLIPGLNDDMVGVKALADFVKDLNPAIPLHFSAYRPGYEMNIPSTPAATVLRAVAQAKNKA